MRVQAAIQQMHDAGLDTGFVVELSMLEATMTRWAEQGRHEGAPALDAAQKYLAAALNSSCAPQQCALRTQRCVSRHIWGKQHAESGGALLRHSCLRGRSQGPGAATLDCQHDCVQAGRRAVYSG